MKYLKVLKNVSKKKEAIISDADHDFGILRAYSGEVVYIIMSTLLSQRGRFNVVGIGLSLKEDYALPNGSGFWCIFSIGSRSEAP